MMNRKPAFWTAWGVGVLLCVPAVASDDDLAVVRKAVAAAPAANARPAQAAEPPAAPRTGRGEPQWLRVRTFAKDGKGEPRKRVSVNLPLALVRALDDFPVDLCHGDKAGDGGRRCEVRLHDVLSSLEAGQELVEVETEDETVKIWVE